MTSVRTEISTWDMAKRSHQIRMFLKQKRKSIQKLFKTEHRNPLIIKQSPIFLYKDKDRDKSCKDINKDVNIENNALSCSDDADEGNNFEKILSSQSWCQSVKILQG